MRRARFLAVISDWAQLLAKLDTIPVDLESWSFRFALMAFAAAVATALLIAVTRWRMLQRTRYKGEKKTI
ncbi:MAG: hypothetical protein QXY49_04475 [Thermofilaceae archaeon]